MEAAVRASIRKLLVVAVVVTALGVGYIARGVTGPSGNAHSAPVPTKKFGVSDLLLAASTAQGLHMRYTGVTTLAFLPDHSNDAPADAFQWGVKRATSGTSAGVPVVDEIGVDRTNDRYSVLLLKQSFGGSNPPATANFYFTDLSGTGGAALDYLEIDLTAAQISGFSTNSGGDRPSEHVSMTFGTITFKYKASSTAPLVTVSYNVATHVVT